MAAYEAQVRVPLCQVLEEQNLAEEIQRRFNVVPNSAKANMMFEEILKNIKNMDKPKDEEAKMEIDGRNELMGNPDPVRRPRGRPKKGG
jgi:hypothetical protein